MKRSSADEAAMNVQGRGVCKRVRGGLAALIALAGLSLAAPAMGQGSGQGSDTSCVVNDLVCSASALDAGSGRCADYRTCFASDTESTYYIADGRRFDCDGLECAQASAELDAFCCPRVDSDAGTGGGRRVNHSDGCALSSRPVPSSDASLAIAGFACLSLLTLRRRV
jgi:hypothetical protein